MSSEDRDPQEPPDCTPDTPADEGQPRPTPIDIREAYPARPVAAPEAAATAGPPDGASVPTADGGDTGGASVPTADGDADGAPPPDAGTASPPADVVPAHGAEDGSRRDGAIEPTGVLYLPFRARDIFVRRFWLFLPMGFLPQIPLLISPLSIEEPTVGGFFSLMFTVLLLVFANAAMILAVAHIHVYGRVRLGRCLADAAQIALPMLLVQLIVGLALFSSFILIAVLIGLPLLLYFLVTLFFAQHAVAIERLNPLMALGRSRWLVRGYMVRVFVVGVLFLLMFAFLHLCIVIPVLLFASEDAMALNIAFAIAAAIATPLITIGGTLTYFDLRARHDGYDLGQLKAEIEQG